MRPTMRTLSKVATKTKMTPSQRAAMFLWKMVSKMGCSVQSSHAQCLQLMTVMIFSMTGGCWAQRQILTILVCSTRRSYQHRLQKCRPSQGQGLWTFEISDIQLNHVSRNRMDRAKPIAAGRSKKQGFTGSPKSPLNRHW